jgi:hypothetical protein
VNSQVEAVRVECIRAGAQDMSVVVISAYTSDTPLPSHVHLQQHSDRAAVHWVAEASRMVMNGITQRREGSVVGSLSARPRNSSPDKKARIQPTLEIVTA